MGLRAEIKWSVNVFKDKWQKLLVVFAFPVIANMILSIPIWFLQIFIQFQRLGAWGTINEIFFILIGIVFLYSILVGLVSMVMQGAAMACTRDIMRDKYLSYKDLWKNIKKYWGGFVKITLWFWLMMLAAYGLIGGIFVIPFFFLDYGGDPRSMICSICMISLLAILLLIVLAAFLTLIVYLSMVIYLTDECSPTRAVGRSIKIFFSNFKELSKAGMTYMLAMMVGSIIPIVGPLIILPIFLVYLFKFYYTHSQYSHKYNVLSKLTPDRVATKMGYDKYR